jgi:hypothetical protein
MGRKAPREDSQRDLVKPPSFQRAGDPAVMVTERIDGSGDSQQ